MNPRTSLATLLERHPVPTQNTQWRVRMATRRDKGYVDISLHTTGGAYMSVRRALMLLADLLLGRLPAGINGEVVSQEGLTVNCLTELVPWFHELLAHRNDEGTCFSPMVEKVLDDYLAALN